MADDGAEADSNEADGPATAAGSLDERLADIHRRTEELAQRVASFRSDTEPGTENEAEPEPEPEATAEPEPVPEATAEPEPDPEPERRHRPRPSAAAPMVYDDDAKADDDHQPEDKKPEEKPTAAAPKESPKEPPKQEAPKEAEKKPAKRAGRGLPGWVRKLRTFVIVIVIALAAAWALRTYVVAPYYVPSASMEPTLHGCSNCNDDHVLVQKLSYDFHDPERGDIVVFDNPGGRWKRADDAVLIKRVIGVPGDKLSIRNRKVYINGQLLDEPYVNKSCHGTTPNGGPRTYKVPKGDLFVMGDNRCDSEDSRVFGPVPIDKVIGKAFLIFWPLGRFGSP